MRASWQRLMAMVGIGLGLAIGSASADELKPGDMAPAFALPGSDGKTYKLEDLRGQVVVIAWFPKAFTGG